MGHCRNYFYLMMMIPLVYTLGITSELPMLGEIKEAEAAKGQGVLTKKFGAKTSDIVCGVNLCSEIPMNNLEKRTFNYHKTPLGQYYFGIPIERIICNPGFELVVKASNLLPACVKPSNVERLIEIGWALNDSDKFEIFRLSQDIAFDGFQSKV